MPDKGKTDFFNPLVSVMSHQGLSTFNFKFKDGLSTDYKSGKEHNQCFSFENKEIRTVKLGYRESDALLTTIELYDVKGKIICSAGWNIHQSTKVITHEMGEDERIVGFRSNKHPEYNLSNHTDFQFVIARFKESE